MRFGIREVTDITFRSIGNTNLGPYVFTDKQPVMNINRAKMSTLDTTAATVYAQGGRGNPRLLAWDGDKAVTFKFDNALISPTSLAILNGASVDNTQQLAFHQKDKSYVATSSQSEVLLNTIPGSLLNVNSDYPLNVTNLDPTYDLVSGPAKYTTINQITAVYISSISASGVITTSATHNLPAGLPIAFVSTGTLTGATLMTTGTVKYFVTRDSNLSATTFKISSTYTNALAGNSDVTPTAFTGTVYIVQFGAAVDSTTTTTLSTLTPHNLTVGLPIAIDGATFAGISQNTVYYVRTTPTAKTFTISQDSGLTTAYPLTAVSGNTLGTIVLTNRPGTGVSVGGITYIQSNTANLKIGDQIVALTTTAGFSLGQIYTVDSIIVGTTTFSFKDPAGNTFTMIGATGNPIVQVLSPLPLVAGSTSPDAGKLKFAFSNIIGNLSNTTLSVTTSGTTVFTGSVAHGLTTGQTVYFNTDSTAGVTRGIPYYINYSGVTNAFNIRLTPSGSNISLGTQTVAFNAYYEAQSIPGTNTFIDYYVIDPNTNTTSFAVSPLQFGGYYYIEANTIFRGLDGNDFAGQITIPKGKIKTQFTLTMSPTGDPTVTSFEIEALPGRTLQNKGTDVLYEIQISGATLDKPDSDISL